MKCPYCNYEGTQVIDSRDTENLEATRRRRECSKCKKRFTTYERVEEADIVVVKKDGKRERFERQKLINGILKACEKRPISLEKIEKLVDEVFFFVSPRIIGGKSAPTSCGGTKSDIRKSFGLRDVSMEAIGKDILIRGKF